MFRTVLLLVQTELAFNVWNTNVLRVFDSGDDLERRTSALPNVLSSASHDNNTADNRSP